MFIHTSFDYSSFIYSSASTVSNNRLEGCFSRSIKKRLRLEIRKKDLSIQLSDLSKFKLVPSRIRLFQRLSAFVIKVVGNNSGKYLANRIKKSSEALRNPYLKPSFDNLYVERPFSMLSSKILKKFSAYSMFKFLNTTFANAWRTGLGKEVLMKFFVFFNFSTIDSKLSFENHLCSIRKKANYKGYFIWRCRALFRFNFTLKIFKLFVIPHFEYCSTVFSPNLLKLNFDSLAKSFH